MSNIYIFESLTCILQCTSQGSTSPVPGTTYFCTVLCNWCFSHSAASPSPPLCWSFVVGRHSSLRNTRPPLTARACAHHLVPTTKRAKDTQRLTEESSQPPADSELDPLLFLLLIVFWAACAFCGPCQPFQDLASYDASATVVLGAGACYLATSGTSSPSLTVLP